MAKLSPVFNDQTVDVNGNPLSGGKLFTYVAGSSTKVTTYTDSAGTVPQTNPIILNSLGYPTNGPIWLTEGQSVKFVLAPSTDTDPPTSPIKTIDNVQGVNDATVSISQWQASGLMPTYVNGNTFTTIGDQTSAFQPGRREQFTVSGGTVYGSVISSAYTTLTTVVMQMDGSQVLDAGLSSVNHSILLSNPSALPYTAASTNGIQLAGLLKLAKGADIASATTVNLSTATGNTVNLTGTTPVTAWTMVTGQRMRVNFTAATPITYNAITNRIQGGSSITGEIGSYLEIYYDGTTTFVTYILDNGAAASGPSYTTVPAAITTTGQTLTANAVGVPTRVNSASATTTTLMAVSTLIDGQSFTLTNIGAGIATFNRAGSDTITGCNLIAATSISLNQGESVTLTRDSSTSLIVTASNVGFFGPPQTWQTVTRAYSTSYTNSTGRTIQVEFIAVSTGAPVGYISGFVSGLEVAIQSSGFSSGWQVTLSFSVPAGAIYSFSNSVAAMNIVAARELR